MFLKYFGLIVVVIGMWMYWYINIDLPDDIQEHWKVKVIDANLRTFGHMARFLAMIGLTTPFSNLERRLADKFCLLMTTGSPWVSRDDPALKITDLYTDKNHILLRVFEPKTSMYRSNRPVLIYFHGGGFSSLSVDAYDGLTKTIAKRSGVIVVSVEYRLSPQFSYPIPLEDCLEGVNHIIDHASNLGIDASRIAVGGDSAGGNFAAAVSLKLRDKIKLQLLLVPVLQFFNYNTSSIFENQKYFSASTNNLFQIVFWLNYVGLGYEHMFDIMANRHVSGELLASEYARSVDQNTWMDRKYIYTPALKGMTFNGRGLSRHDQKETVLLAEFVSRMTDPFLCPLMADREQLRGLPRAYVMTAKYDMIRDDGIMYYSRLKEAGVDAHLANYDTFHNFLTIVNGPLALDTAKAIVQDLVNYIQIHL